MVSVYMNFLCAQRGTQTIYLIGVVELALRTQESECTKCTRVTDSFYRLFWITLLFKAAATTTADRIIFTANSFGWQNAILQARTKHERESFTRDEKWPIEVFNSNSIPYIIIKSVRLNKQQLCTAWSYWAICGSACSFLCMPSSLYIR